MILDTMHDETLFRQAIRDWLRATLEAGRAKGMVGGGASFYDAQQWWMAERNRVGLGTPHWPSAYGGADMSLKNQVIVAEEIARARAPSLVLFTISLNHIPATLIKWGSEAQRGKYLPGVAKGVVWCQGFSEPGAGSDLAGLRTRAVRQGDHYVVNGQKIWSSFSMYAQHCILLTRTDASQTRHRGITYLIMDMTSPGVEVRPLRQSNGEAKFAEMFLTDVRIPVGNLVGEEGEGWTVAQTTLSAERGVLAFEAGERLRYGMEDFYAGALARGDAWLRDDELRREFMRLFSEMQASRRLLRRLLRESEKDAPSAMATAIYVKLVNTSLKRSVGEFMLRTQGIEGHAVGERPDDIVGDPIFIYLTAFGGTIAGGSNEIMRNILSERVLGMPRM